MSELPTLPAQMPINPEVQRVIQHLMQLTQDGKITGVAFVAITTNGEVMSSHALPVNPSILYLVMGALNGLLLDLGAAVAQLRQQQQVSRILKPQMMRHNG